MTVLPVCLWSSFALVVLAMLWIDFRLFSGQGHEVKVKEALVWSGIWIAVAFVFNVGIFFFGTHEQSINFLTGYLIERALSMDNIFVFLLIFNFFKVPSRDQQTVLFWGIMLALAFRVVFIAAGVALISAFSWTVYVLGAFLVFVGIKMLFTGDKKIDLEQNRMLRLLRKVLPVSADYHGNRFVVKVSGVRTFTPLVIVFIMVAVMDIIFAVDSIPAILAVTTDPFVVYTSNIFAILGLRALFSVLAGLAEMFRYLNVGLSLILVLIGVKMLASNILHVPVIWVLTAVAAILAASVVASVVLPSRK